MQSVGPVKLVGTLAEGDFMLPLATFESPLWPSVNRGARVSQQSGGIRAVVLDDRMTRSVLLVAPDAEQAAAFCADLGARKEELGAAATGTSRFAQLADTHFQVVGNLIYLRLAFTTGDAAGHNMVTGAAEGAIQWILSNYENLEYGSISGNFCTDKKASAVNGILGRGKYVITEMTIPDKICRRFLKTTPEKIHELNIRKNLVGTMLAGGVRTANAHFANMLLAFYLATGQDAANIVEGSQGIVYTEIRNGDLYFSCTLPNIIVGTVGNGKDLDFVRENLEQLGCLGAGDPPGSHAKKLAVLAAAACCCGELSLLAAQTNPGELMDAHRRLERGQSS